MLSDAAGPPPLPDGGYAAHARSRRMRSTRAAPDGSSGSSKAYPHLQWTRPKERLGLRVVPWTIARRGQTEGATLGYRAASHLVDAESVKLEVDLGGANGLL